MKGIQFTARGVTQIIDEPQPTCGEQEVLLWLTGQAMFSD